MSGGALSDDDLKDIAEGMPAASMQIFMDQVNAIAQQLAEEYAPPLTPWQALRHAASYFPAVDVKLGRDEVLHVVNFLNAYADQLEDCAD